MNDEVTLGELNRNFGKLEKKIDSITEIITSAPTQTTLETAIINARNVSQQQIDEIRVDIAEINSWRTWFQRVVGSAIIVALIGFMISGGLTP